MKRLVTAMLALAAAASAAPAEVVVQRWGVGGRVQHPKTLTFNRHDQGREMRFDLSAMPKGAAVYRARLLVNRPGYHGRAFDIVPVQVMAGPPAKPDTGPALPEIRLKVIGQPLPVAAPHYQWLDATEAVRAAQRIGDPGLSLLIRKAPRFDQKTAVLEVAFEGRLADPPAQVKDVKAFYRDGQVFITFREIEDIGLGKETVTWGDLATRFKRLHYTGPIPRDEKGEVRYRVYQHTGPITPQTLGKAKLLGEVVPGSGYNTRLVPGGDFIKQRPKAVPLRIAVEPGKPLPAGYGLYVHTVGRNGNYHYAVLAAADGLENTTDVGAGNAVGPIQQRRVTPQPVLQRDVVTKLRGAGDYHEQWYSYWAVPPQANRPLRYDLAVGFCPERMARPAALEFTRGHTWGPNPEMPRPAPRPNVVISMSTDPVNGFWTGIHECRDTLRGVEQGKWQPFTHNRQEALIRWARTRWPIDPQRIVGSTGAWGLWEFRRADLYSYIHGWGMPEITKGFQCWNWGRGVWGPPEMYKGVPDKSNPWVLQDYTTWILANPTRELPYFQVHRGWGAHFEEMGWPPFPRFVRAMMDTRRAFSMNSTAVSEAMRQGIISIRRDQSLPALGNCSLDDNIGEGDLRSGRAFGQINGFLVWESATTVDEPGLWQVTCWLWASGRGAAPLDECTVDLTPRRCQKFKAKGGQKFDWTNRTCADGKLLQSGQAVADEHGLVTIKGLKLTKAKHRITFRPAK